MGNQYGMKDNFRKYWKEQLTHFAIPALMVGGAMVVGGVNGLPMLTAPALMGWRQYVEYLKRKDTPGIDLAYIVAGAAAGGVVGMILRLTGVVNG